MATGSRNSGFQWDNPFHEQEETPAELRKRRKKEAKEKEAKEKEKREAREKEKREAKEREKEAKRKEVKEKEAKRREAKEKEKDLERQKHSSDKNSQGQPHIPDTTDHFGIPNIPVDLDKTWAVFTGEGRKSSAPSDSSLSPPSPQKMESVSVMPNKEEFLTLPDVAGAVSLDETESYPVYSDREMKKQLEKERDHPSTSTMLEVHLQNQEVDKGDTSFEFRLVNEKANLVAEKLELETQQIALKEEIDVLNNKVENVTKQNEDLSLELSQTKNELQYTKESLEREKKDALNALSLVETEKATLVAKLQLDLLTAEAVKRELQNDKEYWSRSQSSKEVELKAKLASVQDELTAATANKVAIEKQYIRVHGRYEELQKRVDQLQTELSTAQEGMKVRDITIGELNGRIKERTETRNIQLKGDQISLKEKVEEIDGLQHKNQVLKEDMKKKDEELLNLMADFEKMRKDFEKDKMEFERLIQKLNQEQDEINDATTTRIKKLESDLEQKEQIITQYFQELKQKEQLRSRLDGKDRVHIEQLNSQMKSDSLENIQSTGGAGGSPHTSLSEEGKKLADLYLQVAAKDDKIADLEKQLYLITMESNSLKETKKQLEQMMQRGEGSLQQSTLTPDHMALIAQMEEYDKAKQDLEAEKNAMKNVGEKNSELQMEVDRLKKQLLWIKKDSQSGTTVLASPVNMSETATSQFDDSSVEDLRRMLKEREEEAKALVDSINQKEKTLTNTIGKYEDLLKSTMSVSKALNERNEHAQKQSKKIVQFRKEAEYYRSETERLTSLNQQLDVGGHQLQEEAATVQKSLYRVKHELSEMVKSNKELQQEIQKLELTVEEREEEVNKIRNELDIKKKRENVEIKELQSALSSQQQSLLAANEQVGEMKKLHLKEMERMRNSNSNLVKKIEDLQRKLRSIEKELQVQSQISYDTSVQMKTLKASYGEKSILLNHIAELEHQLFQLKMRLNEPLSKLESLTRKLATLPREFRYQQQLLQESKEAILNVQRDAEVVQSFGEMGKCTHY